MCIRDSYYGNKKDENAYIKVDSYDQEWYESGKLIDFTIDTSSNLGNGFALTYGNPTLNPTTYSVSYTHLDVYKRQLMDRLKSKRILLLMITRTINMKI